MEQTSIQKFLNSLPEWSDDWQMHALFCSYNNKSNEQFMLTFWQHAIEQYFAQGLGGLNTDVETLKNVFNRNGRRPVGLEAIIQHFIQKGVFLDTRKILETAQPKESWKSWIVGKVSGFVFTQPEPPPLSLVPTYYLDQLCSVVSTWGTKTSSKALDCAELQQKLKTKYHCTQTDCDVLLARLQQKGEVKFHSEVIGSKTVDLILFGDAGVSNIGLIQIKMTQDQLKTQLDTIETKMRQSWEKAKEQKAMGNKTEALRHLKRRKLLQKQYEELDSKMLTLDEQLLAIESAESNVAVYQGIKQAVDIQNRQQIDIAEVEKLKEKQQEASLIAAELTETLTSGQIWDEAGLEAELEEMTKLDQELEAEKLVLPNVPKHPINPVISETAQQREERKENLLSHE